MRLLISAFILLVFSAQELIGQNYEELCARYITEHLDEYELLDSDVSEMVPTRIFQSKHNQLTHAYFQQKINNIPINEAILNFKLLRFLRKYAHGHFNI